MPFKMKSLRRARRRAVATDAVVSTRRNDFVVGRNTSTTRPRARRALGDISLSAPTEASLSVASAPLSSSRAE